MHTYSVFFMRTRTPIKLQSLILEIRIKGHKSYAMGPQFGPNIAFRVLHKGKYGPESYKSSLGPKYYCQTGLLYIITLPGMEH